MNLDLRPFFVLWVILAASVIVLIVRRKMVASHEDDTLHVMQGAAVTQQVVVANKLEQIDRWGKILTAIAVAFGLLVAGAYVYQVWVNSTQINPGA